jgi:hypothetical protein
LSAEAVADPLSRPELKMVSKMPLRDPALAADVAPLPDDGVLPSDEDGDEIPAKDEAGDAVDVCWVEVDPPLPQAKETNAQRAIKTGNAYFISEIPLHRMMIRDRAADYVKPVPLGSAEEDGASARLVTI